MKKYLVFILLTAITFSLFSQETSVVSMDSYYRNPKIEDAERNIILQNRCGNRLSLLMHEAHMDLEFVYKPNAFRRKNYRARNFSNRDVFTKIFKEASLPFIEVDDIKEFNYDPFNTVLETEKAHGAKNEIRFINIADENAFAISAKAPLLIAVKPHHAFKEENGLLTENFTDRGEDIVSFISFESYDENRFRRVDDGSYVLQIFEDETVIFGAEENEYQVQRVRTKLKGLSFKDLLSYNENKLNHKINKGLVSFNDPEFQNVIDLNHRIVYSGIDEGGACFGALNRIYYLIWVRDGSMTSSLMARSGNPELIKLWAPFLLNNPSYVRNEAGERIPQFLQIVGNRWTKSEDDGVFYAALSLYTYFKTLGDDQYFYTGELETLVNAIDHFLEKTWSGEKKMVISDTRGETPLRSNPYYGYDAVDGSFEINDHADHDGKIISKSASLYNQVNTYNLLLMTCEMMQQNPSLDKGRIQRYKKVAIEIQNNIKSQYVDDEGYLYAEYLEYDDGSKHWQKFAKGADYWEYAWAVSLGPYYPALDLQLKSARMVPERWPEIRTYGYCPWNTVSRILYEYGMGSGEYKEMLSEQINEANQLTYKYPMPGALTEYQNAVNSWRALPFSAGSLFYTVTGQILQSLPSGIAVRASSNVDRLEDFYYKSHMLEATTTGNGDVVASYNLNGNKISYSLQLPVADLFPGRNVLEIKRTTEQYNDFRLYGSNASLLSVDENSGEIVYKFKNNLPSKLVFDNYELAKEVKIYDQENNSIMYDKAQLLDTGFTTIDFDTSGIYYVKVQL